MCIRSPFTAAIAAALELETFIEPEDRDDVVALLERTKEPIFAHPLALARHLVKHAMVDDEAFGDCATTVGPIVRGYVRLRKRHGDLFADTAHALPPIGKPMLAKGYSRLARAQREAAKIKRGAVKAGRIQSRRELARQDAQQKRDDAATIARYVTANPKARELGPNAVDLAAARARRNP